MRRGICQELKTIMKAIQITEFGGPEKMSLIDIAEPVAGDGEVSARCIENWN
jgi:hypothetical protein